MGVGFFTPATGQFDLVLSVRYNASSGELDKWRASFERASRLLFDATDEQHQFGNIYVCNNSTGTNIADAWLRDDNGTAESNGYAVFRTLGIHMVFYQTERFRPFIIVHEFGHHVYGLYDEYLSPGLGGEGECIGGTTADACIMEAYWEDGDQINEATGSLIPGRVSEFCVEANHTTNNLQHAEHGQSCWNTMRNGNPGPPHYITGYSDLVLPSPLPVAAPPAVPVPDPFNWIVLAPEQRFVLVVDRSGSMTGDKLNETKLGARFWADSARIGDRISVVSYSDTVDVDYPLQPITAGMDRTPIRDAIDLISAGGLTAIGDGLREGMDQIVSDGKRGWQNVIALVTDGHHNDGEPPGDVLPDLVDNGVRVYPIGIGTSINESLLQDIATTTGGTFYRIDPTLAPEMQRFEIRNDLIEIEGLAHSGGLVISIPGSTNPDVGEEEAYIEPGSEMATFTLSWKNPQDLLFLELESPDGDHITLDSAPANVRPIYSQRPYMGFQVKEPAPGTWKLVVKPERVADVAHFHLFAFSQNPHIDGGLISPRQLCQPGLIMPLQFQCYFDQPITGLKVSGTVLTPGGESIPLEFSDDGNRELGDVLPGDGLYSTLFQETRMPGMYTIKVTAESDGKSVSYARIGKPSDEDEEDERDPIPPFRRQFTRTVGVGEVPFKDVKTEPNSGYPGESLQVTLKGQSTHFKRGYTSADFGEGIDAEEVEVLDKHTAQMLITIAKEAQLGLRDVTITTARYRETIEVEGGFQVVRRQSKWSVNLARLWKLLQALRQGLAFVDEIAPKRVL